MRFLRYATLALLTLLACCGTSRTTEGEGWSFMVHARSQYIPESGISGAEIFWNESDLNAALELLEAEDVRPIDFDEHVVLWISGTEETECGSELVERLEISGDRIAIIYPEDIFCEAVGGHHAQLFLLERAALPQTPFTLDTRGVCPILVTSVG